MSRPASRSDAIGVGHFVDGRNHVLARGEPERGFGVCLFEAGDELSQLGVEIGNGLVGGFAIGAALLGGVIQVRQVQCRKSWVDIYSAVTIAESTIQVVD